MPLPLFDNVVVDAVPPQEERPARNPEREEFERDRFATAGPIAPRDVAPFDLDGDERPKSHRPPPVRPGHPCYFAYWQAFARGVDGQSPPGVEHDEDIARYAADGYHTGKIVGDIRKQARARGDQEKRDRRWRR